MLPVGTPLILSVCFPIFESQEKILLLRIEMPLADRMFRLEASHELPLDVPLSSFVPFCLSQTVFEVSAVRKRRYSQNAPLGNYGLRVFCTIQETQVCSDGDLVVS